METFGQYMVCGALLAWVACAFIAYVSYGRLLDLQMREHRESWEHDGKPYIWFYQAPRSAYQSRVERHLTAQLASVVCAVTWLLFTPPWIGTNAEEVKIHRRYRVALAIALTVLALWACMLVLPGPDF